MAKEIEKKFLLLESSFLEKLEGVNITQGYFRTDGKSVVRVRIYGEKAYITIKGKMINFTRSEFEYEIPKQDGLDMIEEFCDNRVVEKIRYRIEYCGKIWEVDKFLGRHLGLFVAEIELKSELEEFEKPPWAGKDVSKQSEYHNVILASL